MNSLRQVFDGKSKSRGKFDNYVVKYVCICVSSGIYTNKSIKTTNCILIRNNPSKHLTSNSNPPLYPSSLKYPS